MPVGVDRHQQVHGQQEEGHGEEAQEPLDHRPEAQHLVLVSIAPVGIGVMHRPFDRPVHRHDGESGQQSGQKEHQGDLQELPSLR